MSNSVVAGYLNQLFQVVYHSISLTDAAGEQSILNTSRLNNTKRDISGCLISCNGQFLQILEGQQHIILDLINSIRNDNRHKDFVIMKMCIIKEPMFKNWSMASYSADEQTFLQVLTSYGESDNATEKMIYEYIAYGKEASPADIQVSSVKG
jgi:hypothetical protein